MRLKSSLTSDSGGGSEQIMIDFCGHNLKEIWEPRAHPYGAWGAHHISRDERNPNFFLKNPLIKKKTFSWQNDGVFLQKIMPNATSPTQKKGCDAKKKTTKMPTFVEWYTFLTPSSYALPRTCEKKPRERKFHQTQNLSRNLITWKFHVKFHTWNFITTKDGKNVRFFKINPKKP